jgi:16S rRNA (guanine966-N2)-methyltransferase
MRVIAGKAKGRRLVAPKGLGTRPTSDRVKENLFNIIADRVAGAKVLDLYAGSGGLAIEALSRGAESAVLVEADRRAREAIDRNLATTGLSGAATVLAIDSMAAVERFGEPDQAFDLILFDPPYKIEAAELEAALIKAAGCLSERGLMVLEHRADLPALEIDSKLNLVDRRRYGDTGLSFYEKKSG